MKTSPLVGLAAIAVLATSCSSEKLTEGFIENRIEAEGGEDVDVDFDLEDGNFSIKTEDGEVDFDFDADGDGGGNFSINGSDGSEDFSIKSENGETVIESDEGTSTFSTSEGELPEGFPDSVPLPDDYQVQFGQVTSTPDGDSFVVAIVVPGDHGDVTGSFAAALTSNGFEQQQMTTTPDGSFFGFDNGEHFVTGGAAEGEQAGQTGLTLTIIANPSE